MPSISRKKLLLVSSIIFLSLIALLFTFFLLRPTQPKTPLPVSPTFIPPSPILPQPLKKNYTISSITALPSPAPLPATLPIYSNSSPDNQFIINSLVSLYHLSPLAGFNNLWTSPDQAIILTFDPENSLVELTNSSPPSSLTLPSRETFISQAEQLTASLHLSPDHLRLDSVKYLSAATEPKETSPELARLIQIIYTPTLDNNDLNFGSLTHSPVTIIFDASLKLIKLSLSETPVSPNLLGYSSTLTLDQAVTNISQQRFTIINLSDPNPPPPPPPPLPSLKLNSIQLN